MEYTVIVVDGDAGELCAPYAGSVRLEGLGGEERDRLLRLGLVPGVRAMALAQAGAAELLPVRTASCGALMRFAQATGQWETGVFRPGDVVIYDFEGNGSTDHTGIVERVTASGVVAIEGNTGTGNGAKALGRQK